MHNKEKYEKTIMSALSYFRRRIVRTGDYHYQKQIVGNKRYRYRKQIVQNKRYHY